MGLGNSSLCVPPTHPQSNDLGSTKALAGSMCQFLEGKPSGISPTSISENQHLFWRHPLAASAPIGEGLLRPQLRPRRRHSEALPDFEVGPTLCGGGRSLRRTRLDLRRSGIPANRDQFWELLRGNDAQLTSIRGIPRAISSLRSPGSLGSLREFADIDQGIRPRRQGRLLRH
jgi:hypothetical protein